MESFPGGTPDRSFLDALVPDRPVFLPNRDHHGAWVNTRALEIAGIDARTPDPVDGRIERDADGVPTGMLQEGAMELVAATCLAATEADLVDGLRPRPGAPALPRHHRLAGRRRQRARGLSVTWRPPTGPPRPRAR